MQAGSASRRALSSLASKIHPPMPLTSRESQQLLTLLTTSFRTHLDHQPIGAPSPHSAASEHIGSILSNPLFAHRPKRRASDSVAVHVLDDPLGWFVDEIASGTADISKAGVCLAALQTPTSLRTSSLPRRDASTKAKPASIIAEWLQSSGQETTKEFVSFPLSGTKAYVSKTHVVDHLVPMLIAEGNYAPLWRWWTYSPAQRIKDTGFENKKIASFRDNLLVQILKGAPARDQALGLFKQAFIFEKSHRHEPGYGYKHLRLAGGQLVNMIVQDPQVPCSPEVYNDFTQSVPFWLSGWSPFVQAMLSLHHPTNPDPEPGFALLQARNEESITQATSIKSRRRFVVRLCLGLAQQLIKEYKLSEATWVMNFTQTHFADLVLRQNIAISSRHTKEAIREEAEKKNLALLDQVLPV